jgi:hypothetical protein
MDMQDREFDELFRSKLDGLEAEPSANVWPGIAGELDSAKRGRSLAPWLSIAASIVVLMGVAVLFIPKKAHTNLPPSHQKGMAKIVQPVKASQSVTVQPSVAMAYPAKINKGSAIARVQNNKSISPSPVKNIDTTSSPAKASSNDTRQLMANVPQKPVVITNPVVPDPVVKLVVAPAIDAGTTFTKPDQTVITTASEDKKDSTIVKHRHKIHNFGDLVNLVVDKLDKRQDKVIHFSDDEEGDSHLVAVNLGVVKIKKGE